jgi:hypothetical protein
VDIVHEALLDTGSGWCVLPPLTAPEIGIDLDAIEADVRIHTRLGTFAGSLVRISLEFEAWLGGGAPVDATWFVCADWPGPMVLGWQGCLERIRFGLDPTEDAFYFAGQ